MKIKVRKKFKYTFDNVNVHELVPGEYAVPADVTKEAAELAITFGNAVLVMDPVAKKAPENKVVTKAPENKKRAKKAK